MSYVIVKQNIDENVKINGISKIKIEMEYRGKIIDDLETKRITEIVYAHTKNIKNYDKLLIAINNKLEYYDLDFMIRWKIMTDITGKRTDL